MAEGAGALVLESLAHAPRPRRDDPGRGGRLRRGGRRVPPHPVLARRQADHRLHDARAGRCRAWRRRTIGYVNAHGTGTPENDKMEWVGVSAVFGERAGSIPISSNKSMIGHTLTAAGTVEAIFTLLTMRHGVLPPTINYETPDPALPLDCVPNVARRGEGGARDLELVRLWRAECLPRARRGTRARMTPRALVIGGRRGIGAAVVQALSARGFAVTYTYRTDPGEFPAGCRSRRAARPGRSRRGGSLRRGAGGRAGLGRAGAGRRHDLRRAGGDDGPGRKAEQAMQVNLLRVRPHRARRGAADDARAQRPDRRGRLGDRPGRRARATPPTARPRPRCWPM